MTTQGTAAPAAPTAPTKRQFVPFIVQEQQATASPALTNVPASKTANDEAIYRAMARDIRVGSLDGKLTYRVVKTRYKLLVDKRIALVLRKLESTGMAHRKGKGKSFYAGADPAARKSAVA